MKKIQKGFTLIELMIVVAIIGILAAVAIPAYQDYIVKAKLTKVQSTIDPIKLALALYYQENGSFPNATVTTTATDPFWTSIGLPYGVAMPAEVDTTGTKFQVDGTVNTSNAVNITIVFKSIKASGIDGLNMVIQGAPNKTAITWTCVSKTITDTIPIKYFGC